ncbi:MAG: hypothetical protein QM608_22635 [Caulobacter sp.]
MRFALLAPAPLAALAWLALSAAGPAAAQDRLIIDGRAYGPSQRIAGGYFSNWENSVVTACRGDKTPCTPPVNAQREWLNCAPQACAELERRIKAFGGDLAGGVGAYIVFEGRRTLDRKPKRHMHDTESQLYAERILSVSPRRD